MKYSVLFAAIVFALLAGFSTQGYADDLCHPDVTFCNDNYAG